MRGNVGGRGYGGGGWRIIKEEIARMQRVEHNTNFGYDVMNEDSIEDFNFFGIILGKFSI